MLFSEKNFSPINHTFLKNTLIVLIGCVSFRVPIMPRMQKCSNHVSLMRRKRVFPFTSQAAITIEASIAMTLFIIVLVSIEGFLMILNAQFTMETTVNNVAIETAKLKYYVNKDDEQKDKKNKILAVSYLSGRLLAELNNSGNKLVYAYNTTSSKIENGKVDVVLNYNVKIPYTQKSWRVTERAKAKDWTGTDLTKDDEIVYITKYGTVYHTTKECSHLIINIRETTFTGAERSRNKTGHKYKRCEYCVRGAISPLAPVFITSDGDRYHIKLDCSGLTRSVIEISKSEVGNRRPCSSCG